MVETSIAQNESPDSTQPHELTSPQFDETAVALAQPVQPLPRRPGLSFWSLSRESIAVVAAFAVVLIGVAVAAASLIVRSGHAPTNEVGSRAEQTSQGTEPGQTETAPTAAGEPSQATDPAVVRTAKYLAPSRKVMSRSRSENPSIPINTDDEGKPAARKVGEIRYGRPPDRP